MSSHRNGIFRCAPRVGWLVGVFVLSLTACDVGGGTEARRNTNGECIIPQDELAGGCPGRENCISALWNPKQIQPSAATFLNEDSRIIGLMVDGQAYAVPLNVLWWHEIANLDIGNEKLAVTYCPLTGSSLAFDRTAVRGRKFGVSGLLFKNNLTMYDSTSRESLWPQMNREAGCGPRAGAHLNMHPVIEMTWSGWRSLHPNAQVTTGTKDPDQYTRYPYGNYDHPNNERLLVPMEIDTRRPPKERVLGIPKGEGGIAFPFGALDDGMPMRAVEETRGRQEAVVVFWDRVRQSATAYRPFIDDERLSFTVNDGRIQDRETGSTWRVDGMAISGPLDGRQLEPFAKAYVAFWFAWAAFHPDTRLWGGS